MYKLLSLVLFTACATSDAKPATTTSASTEHKDLCVQTMTRARACTDAFIPALVDVRAKLDKPAGIKDMVAKDRDAVIAQAKTEWADDSMDAAINKQCDAMSANSTEQMDAAAKDCLAKTDCGAFTACVMPLFENHLAK